jgi:hypothetical protein
LIVMSCDVALAAFLMFSQAGPAVTAHPVPAVAQAPVSVASEPLFIDIVGRARTLKEEVEAYRHDAAGGTDAAPLPHFDQFSAAINALAALDEQGHKELVARGNTDDLKCILHGISQDLGAKLAAVQAAKSGHDEDVALRDMSYLLNDNVEVITAPPQPAA